MAKTYQLKALWPLLPFKVAAAPLLATLDYGGGLVKHAVSQDGIWLFSSAQPLSVDESENLTGFHPADLVPKQIDGVEGYFYAMQGGAPLLPLPFTKDQLVAFEKRMAGLIGSCIERGDVTDAWIADLEKDNPDAAELARGIHGNQWPLDLPDLLKQMDDQKEVEKLLGNTAGSLADVYRQAQSPQQTELEKITAMAVGSIAHSIGQLERAGLDIAMGRYYQATAIETFEQMERERMEKANERVVPSWSLNMPKRFQGYSKPLYDHLKAAHGAGKTRPTARNVLDDWKLNRPHEVTEIANEGLKYYAASGNTKPADLAAIRKAINRMTTKRTTGPDSGRIGQLHCIKGR